MENLMIDRDNKAVSALSISLFADPNIGRWVDSAFPGSMYTTTSKNKKWLSVDGDNIEVTRRMKKLKNEHNLLERSRLKRV